MLRFRIAAPADQIAPLHAELLTDHSVSSVVLHRGASVKPSGDVLETDVARDATGPAALDDHWMIMGHPSEVTSRHRCLADCNF